MNNIISGIYQIRNIVNENIYIGSAVNIDNRWSSHISKLNNNKHHNKHLQSAWNMYGSKCFKFAVIEHCNISELITREQYYIDILNPKYNYNKKAGSSFGTKHTQESRNKMSLSRMGNKNTLGYRPSEETKLKMSISAKNKVFTEEHRKNISIAGKGKKRKPFTKEHKKKLSIAATNRFSNKNERNKISEAMKGKKTWTGKKHTEQSRIKISIAKILWWKKNK